MQHNACKLVVAGGEESPPSIAGAPLGRIRVAPRSLSYSPVSKFRRTKVEKPHKHKSLLHQQQAGEMTDQTLGKDYGCTQISPPLFFLSKLYDKKSRRRKRRKDTKTALLHPAEGEVTTYHLPLTSPLERIRFAPPHHHRLPLCLKRLKKRGN